ncbi:hypothetical protein [Streptomyces venezuelae]|uniref:hypothetical protein n=1 Tax=Streptomyces venezuelae TaxID=54571 RepID=UPI0037980A4C
MGRGNTGASGGLRRLSWSNDEWNRAAALCAGQLPLVWLVWWFVMEAGRDDYGRGGGFLGIVCVPLVLPLLGVLHATVQIMPAVSLARLRPRTARGPEWSWHLAGSVLIGAAWSALGRAVWGWPVGDTLPWVAGIGVLPVLVLARLRGRPWGWWGVWLRSAGGSFVLFAVCGVAAASLAGQYKPPELSAGQLVGYWRDTDGGVLRLAPGGRAVLTRVPTQDVVDEDGDFGGGHHGSRSPTAHVRDKQGGLGPWLLPRVGKARRVDEVNGRPGALLLRRPGAVVPHVDECRRGAATGPRRAQFENGVMTPAGPSESAIRSGWASTAAA